ncbi:MAG: hypothetical protein K9M75_09155 [Phycisphaerae bacterium]|nr:hypothetical protein [Phycisphaerae bacterium]
MTDGLNKIENKTPGITRQKNLRMLLLSMVILVAGIVIGSAGTTLIIGKNSREIHPSGPGSAERMTSRLKERLDLSDEQFAKIEPIIKTHMDKLRDIQDKARPLIESQVTQMKNKISNLLTDDQKQTWETQMKFLERGFRMQRGSGRGHGPGEGRGGSPYGPGSQRVPREGQEGGRGFVPGGGGRGPGSPRGMQPPPGPGGEMWRQRQLENPDFQRPPLPPIQDQNTTQ